MRKMETNKVEDELNLNSWLTLLLTQRVRQSIEQKER